MGDGFFICKSGFQWYISIWKQPDKSHYAGIIFNKTQTKWIVYMKKFFNTSGITLVCCLTAAILSSCGYYEAQENREKMAQIRIGMTKAQVIRIMGEPPAENYQTDKILFYYTNPQWYDGFVTRDECTPFVFAEFEDRLVGFGAEYYRNHILLPDWEKQKSKPAAIKR